MLWGVNNYQEIVCLILPIASVPVFFTLSGYFLFNKYDYLSKLKTRFRTLVVPFLLWCLLGLAIIYVLQCVLGLENLFANSKTKLIKDFTVLDYLRSFWDIRDGRFPITSPLWYLRDLIVFVILSPIIKFLIDKTGICYLVAVTVLYLLSFHVGPISATSLFFFSIGAYLMLKGYSEFKQYVNIKNVYISVTLLIITALVSIYKVDTFGIPFKLYVMSYVPTCYYIASLECVRDSKILAKITEASFFVYLFHEPWLGYIQKVFYKVVQLPDWTVSFMIFVFPIIILIVGMLLYNFMRRFVPGFLGVLTGAR